MRFHYQGLKILRKEIDAIHSYKKMQIQSNYQDNVELKEKISVSNLSFKYKIRNRLY